VIAVRRLSRAPQRHELFSVAALARFQREVTLDEMAMEMLASGKSKREVARLMRVSVDTITRAITAGSPVL